MQNFLSDKKMAIRSVRRVQVIDGKRTEHELTGKELKQWIAQNVKTEEKTNDNTDI